MVRELYNLSTLVLDTANQAVVNSKLAEQYSAGWILIQILPSPGTTRAVAYLHRRADPNAEFGHSDTFESVTKPRPSQIKTQNGSGRQHNRTEPSKVQ